MKSFAFLVMLLFSVVSFATEQEPELLSYNGEMYEMEYVEPMEQFKDIKIVKNKAESLITSLWRRYRGKYTIENSMLVCKEVSIYQGNGYFKPVCQDVIKDGVVCDWFTQKNIRLIKVRGIPQRAMLEEKEYAMDVKKGKVQIRIAREMPHKRFSYEDLKARKGVEYNPDADNLDTWIELGFMKNYNSRHYNGYSGWCDISTFKNILAKKRIRTRGVLTYSSKSYSRLTLPATRSTPSATCLFEGEYPEFKGKRVEVEIENPLQLSQRIVSIRELGKSESMHNQKSPNAIFRFGEQRTIFTKEVEKLFPQIKKGTIDESKLEKTFSIENRGISLVIKYKVGESLPVEKYCLHSELQGKRDYDIVFHYPNFDFGNMNFECSVGFGSCHFSDSNIDNILNWNLPKKITLGGIEVWRLEKETNKTLKFLVSPLEKSGEIAKSLNDVEALNALALLSDMGTPLVERTPLCKEKIKILSTRIKDINFKKNSGYIYLLVRAVHFNCGRDTAKIYAKLFEDIAGKPTAFNENFIDSPDFFNSQKLDEVATECEKIRRELEHRR